MGKLVTGCCHFLHLIQHIQALYVEALVIQYPGIIHLFVQLNIYIVFIFYQAQTR